MDIFQETNIGFSGKRFRIYVGSTADRKKKKVYPNAPCLCGSGKNIKNIKNSVEENNKGDQGEMTEEDIKNY